MVNFSMVASTLVLETVKPLFVMQPMVSTSVLLLKCEYPGSTVNPGVLGPDAGVPQQPEAGAL